MPPALRPAGTPPGRTTGALRAFARRNLCGAGQVVFLASPMSGLCNFLAIGWAAAFGGTGWAMLLGAFLGTILATATAGLFAVERERLDQGLYGFNGLLVGIAVPTFVPAGALMWGLLLVAAALSTLAAIALERLLAPLRLAGLTFPFVLCSWMAILAARLPAPGLVGLAPAAAAAGAAFPEPAQLLRGVLASVSQIFLVDNPVSGAIFLAGFALHSRLCAGLVLYGAALATLAAAALGADGQTLAQGLWGYSAALTAPAIGCVLLPRGRHALALASAAILLTLLLQAALASVLAPLALPVLTFPFVLASWIVLLAAAPTG